MVKVPLSIANINRSVSTFLNRFFPDYTIYTNPNTQNISIPAFFITFLPTSTVYKNTVTFRDIKNFEYNIHLQCRRDYDEAFLYEKYLEVVQVLNEELAEQYLDYHWIDEDGNDNVWKLLVNDTKWKYSEEALHYYFTITIRAIRDIEIEYIEDYELNIHIREE